MIDRKRRRKISYFLFYLFVNIILSIYSSTIFFGWIGTKSAKGQYHFNRLFQPTLLLGTNLFIKNFEIFQATLLFGQPSY